MTTQRNTNTSPGHWIIDLRLKLGVWNYQLLLTLISLTIALPTVAAFDWLFKGDIFAVDIAIAACSAPIITVAIVAIVNPFVEYIHQLKERVIISQRICKIGSWEWNAASDSVDYSDEALRIFGLHQKDSSGFSSLLGLATNEDAERLSTYLAAVRDGQSPAAIEFCIMHPQRGKRMLRMDSAPLTGTDKKHRGVLGTVQDINERAEAQSARYAAELAARNFLAAIEQSPDGMLLLDAKGVIKYVNPATTLISGYPSEKLLGQIAYFMRPEIRRTPPFAAILRQVGKGQSWHGRITDRRRDGSQYPAYGFISTITDERGNVTHYVCTQQDLSEKENLERQFEQAQKMEALGTLVGGIAHDFNNMLGSITSNLFLASTLAEGHPEIIEKLKRADALCFRSAEMIRQLLAFARKDRVKMRDIDLNAFIREVMKLHASTIHENIQLEVSLCPEPAMVHADAVQLQQVLLNLLNNACHALQGRTQPRIKIRTEIVPSGSPILENHPESGDMDYLSLKVSDNGEGIEPRHLNRIFEPFFTTKGVGEGSGLGLAMVYGAVKRHQGIILVNSAEHAGTTFNILLPCVKTRPLSGHQLQAGIDNIMRGNGETVLLVDDEASFVEAHQGVLEMLGYHCLTARNGREAVDIFAENPNRIDVVLCDIVMPEMGGIEAAGHMRHIRADIPIIFATGYEANDGSLPELASDEIIIPKPFSIIELSHTLRALLAT